MKELSLHLLDLVENSIAAGARRIEIHVEEDVAADRLAIAVSDDGKGMGPELREAATDPFTTTRDARDVGLGLSLLAAAAKGAGGDLQLASELEQGTMVSASFRFSHLDRAPLGRVEDTLKAVASLHPGIEVTFRHRGSDGSYEIRLHELASSGNGAGKRAHIESLVSAGRLRIGSQA